MRRWIALITTFVMLFAIAGCAQADDGDGNGQGAGSGSFQETEEGSKDLPEEADAANGRSGDDGKGSEADEDHTPYGLHGELSLDGTRIVDEHGADFQLRGMSTHGINWFPEYVNEEAFRTLRDEWGLNCIRLALYTAEYDGYCEGGDKEALKGLVRDGVEYASALGMYVIIDWHVLQDETPKAYEEEAMSFFEEMSAELADRGNVLYEICNEPNGDTTWSEVRSYAEDIIPVIRRNSPESIVIVGTPDWSQGIDQVASDPLTGSESENVLYAVHFYAKDHTQWLRDRVIDALDDGIPVFFSEFSTCEASGSGANDFEQAEAWLELADEHDISYCFWSLSNKDDTSSIISPSSGSVSDWSEDELTETGRWAKGHLSTS